MSYPLKSIDIAIAKEKQFKLVDCITNYFPNGEFLKLGDLGLVPGINQPNTTRQVEKVLADYFGSEDAILVLGSGTGALRVGLASMLTTGNTVLVHQAPIYPTTKTSIDQMGLNVQHVDFNDLISLETTLKTASIDAVLVQHSRQTLQDHYELSEVISLVRQYKIPVIIDDNYAVMKVDRIGCEMGANLSTFSSFKLLGPEGIGIVVGESHYITKIRKMFYSGGSQVQGHIALDVLRALVSAPVLHAVQAEVTETILVELEKKALKGVRKCYIANAQSKVILIEFEKPIAEAVLKEAVLLGALPYPVGAESKYEIPPLFYKVSGTFSLSDPNLAQRMIRINPNRSGPNTVIRILERSLSKVLS